jgi:1-acyl-sn-glycerol-3-phosphate acyltransferase
VPADGPALLIANHAGALPSDAVMIAKAIKEELPRPRPVHLLSEQQLGRLPGLGMLFTKLGGVGAHPANIHRLLFDEEQLVLLFPEGAAGARKPLKERYRMREFGPMPFVEQALRARAPIVPVAVVGAEEAAPVFARLESLRRLARLPLLPAVALPAKFRVRFLEPVQPTAQAPVRLRRGDMEPGSADRLAEEIRALIQENLFEMVAARRSVWLG